MLGAFSPQAFGRSEWINLVLLPPSPLIACGMVLVMVDGAKRHGELVAHLETQPPRLCKADMMRMGRNSAADEAGLAADEA